MVKFSVNWWVSHPNDKNDDCWAGEDFDSEATARAAFLGEIPECCDGCMHVELVGPELHEVRVIPGVIPGAKHGLLDDEWKNEAAMQAGMAFGCDGYNDEMGY